MNAAKQNSVEKVFQEILHKIEPVNLKEKLRQTLTDQTTITQKDFIWIINKEICRKSDQLRYHLAYKSGLIYIYNQSYWQRVELDRFKFFLSQASSNLGYPVNKAEHHGTQQELFKQFFASSPIEPKKPAKEKVLINLQNGTLEIENGKIKLREFQSEDFLTYQLPFGYDSEAICPQYEQFLNTALPDLQAQNVIQEYISYLFSRNLKIEKILFLYGSGSNGKSTLQDIITALLGRENVSNFSLDELMKEHYRINIADKILNCSSETGTNVNGSIFKKLASNEPISARSLYGHPVELDDYSRFIFNVNSLSQHTEKNHAFYRRLLIVPFTVHITDDQKDIHLAEKITGTELSGILNWVLVGLERLHAQQDFSNCPMIEDLLTAYKDNGDEVEFFLEDRSYFAGKGDKIHLQTLYDEYQVFCKNEDCKPLGKMNFSKQVENKGFKKDRDNKGPFFHIASVN